MVAPTPPANALNVDYILTSTFDIDTGPIILHQYPPQNAPYQPVSLDDSLIYLPELLLPDQIHTRAEDSSVFMLYRNAANEFSYVYDTARGFNETFYGFNILQTKLDAELRRGSVIKSLCLVTRLPFFHVFRPVMVVALDSYFDGNTESCLHELYTTVNEVPILQMHRYTQLSAVRAMLVNLIIQPSLHPYLSAFKSQFRNKLLNLKAIPDELFARPMAELKPTTETRPESLPVTHTSSPTRLVYSSTITDETSRLRGLTLDTDVVRFGDYDLAPKRAKPVRGLTLGPRPPPSVLYRSNEIAFEALITFQGLMLPLRVPIAPLEDRLTVAPMYLFLKKLMDAGCTVAPTELAFSPGANNRASLLLAGSAGLKLAKPASPVVPQGTPANDGLRIYGPGTPPVIVLINAVLSHRRIVVLGYHEPAQTVCDYVCHLVQLVNGGGLLTDLLRRVFPYIDISKLDTLEPLESYIIGTANPIFKQNPRWWDVLWDLDANEIVVATPQAAVTPQGKFGEDLFSIIREDARFLTGLKDIVRNHHDETTIELFCRRHMNEILRMLHSPPPGLAAPQADMAATNAELASMVLPGLGYAWASTVEYDTYAAVRARFFAGTLTYTLAPPALTNDDGVWMDVSLALNRLERLNAALSLPLPQTVASDATSLSLPAESPLSNLFPGSFAPLRVQFQTNLPGTTHTEPGALEIFRALLGYVQRGAMETFLLSCHLLPAASGRLADVYSNLGLDVIFFNMFNKSPRVRAAVLRLLQEIERHPVGKFWMNEMNGFHRNAYEALRKNV
ncbi:hypothetical protein BABINDRAFT_159782 [Babjeviella inositovora NRRL Y-12698]|uniref:UDENN domain-containing protein n=1 Tax=Babjeviella inositovora NRRL Y-12698 TaxID=984486 RepID=A0A1E3QV01_9ASCO|nr:uncharacterized protein BABINDRAFT_159782 [Babjeviella inositovora NRRL Y-12698]ODQ81501.1 hypothetical protein BABINDRAFT_159782 [Babjeviella inositovora NRRL Y-12698]